MYKREAIQKRKSGDTFKQNHTSTPYIGISIKDAALLMYSIEYYQIENRERSGSVAECLTRDREDAGSSLTGVTAL